LVRFLPDRSPSDAPVALAVFWPESQYRAVIARWPGLAALLGSTWDECRARTQRYCLLVDGHGLRVMQLAGDAAGLGACLAAAGVVDPSESDLSAYPDLRTVDSAAMTVWPPERNARRVIQNSIDAFGCYVE
jgi:hypothetical protein